MSQQQKRSVIDRIRAADRWLEVNGGAPMGWVRELLRDAAHELQSESGALWLQTVTGPNGHVRLFVHGPFGVREMDSLLEMLQLTRTWMVRDEQVALASQPAADAVDPHARSTGKPTTRD